MICPHPLLKVYIAEKTTTTRIVAAHRTPRPHPKEAQLANLPTPFFSSLLKLIYDFRENFTIT